MKKKTKANLLESVKIIIIFIPLYLSFQLLFILPLMFAVSSGEEINVIVFSLYFLSAKISGMLLAVYFADKLVKVLR